METIDHQGKQLDLLWGLQAIAKYIGRTERQTEHLISLELIPVTKMGRAVVASAAKLREKLGADEVPAAQPTPIKQPAPKPRGRSPGRPRKHPASPAPVTAAPLRAPVVERLPPASVAVVAAPPVQAEILPPQEMLPPAGGR
jgi:hypothetical protein